MYLDIKKNGNMAEFNRLYFAAQAASKDELKPSLMNVLIEKNRIIGCDGHRLHITEGDVGELKPGQYWPIKIAKTRLIMVRVEAPNLGRYSDVDKVWPDLTDWNVFHIGHVSNPQDGPAIVKNFVKMCRAGDPRGCSYKNFAELLGDKFTFYKFYVKMGSGVCPIVFMGDNGAKGLLMPIGVNED